MKVALQIEIAAPIAQVWDALADVPLIASCVPGAVLTGTTESGAHTGRVTAKVGPVSASFQGEAQFERNESERTGRVLGKGRDSTTASAAKAEMTYRLSTGSGPSTTRVDISSDISLSGMLAQFGKSAVINDIAGRIARTFADNLAARLNEQATESKMASAAPIRTERLLGAMIADWVRSLVHSLRSRIRRLSEKRASS
jgi:carbon-monoxide dehydrogenase small subunit